MSAKSISMFYFVQVQSFSYKIILDQDDKDITTLINIFGDPSCTNWKLFDTFYDMVMKVRMR